MPPTIWAVLAAKSMSPSAVVPSREIGIWVYTGVGVGESETLADEVGLRVGVGVGVGLGVGVGVGVGVGLGEVLGEVLGRGDPDVLGASVGAASTWKSDWPPDYSLKCTEFRF